MNETQKWFAVGFLVLLCVVLIVISDSNTFTRTTSSIDRTFDSQSAVSLSTTSADDMPPMSNNQYQVEELKMLNDIVSGGYVISQYKRVFTNGSRMDYDVEAAYSDYARDFGKYRHDLRQDIEYLKSLNPKLQDARYQQNDTLEKAERLYMKISEYDSHTSNVRDTIQYLNECQYELNRLSIQSKLPK